MKRLVFKALWDAKNKEYEIVCNNEVFCNLSMSNFFIFKEHFKLPIIIDVKQGKCLSCDRLIESDELICVKCDKINTRGRM